MGYNRATRKWGEGYTKWLVHGSGAGYDASGEAEVDTLIAAAQDFGGYSEASELVLETEQIEDEIHQELAPIQIWSAAQRGSLTLRMSLGDIENLAIACGLAASTSVTMPGGTSAKAVTFGIPDE